MSSDGAYLSAAASIGRRIVEDAVWHGGRCTWIGAVGSGGRPWRAESRALQAPLYDGTAGVGLFLAHLAAVTGDAAVHRTAVGALRHAVARARSATPAPRDGFHAGALGIAWAAVCAAELLGEEELHASVRTVLEDAKPLSEPDRCPDLILGSAGSILALLALAKALDEPALVEQAHATGEELLARATVTACGWSWRDPGRRYSHHLCGLAHGAGGIGWALLELFAASGDERFGRAASGAFAYERSWLDLSSGTWPDLRLSGQRRGAVRRFTSPLIGTWAYGEAGIALTRIRAISVLGMGSCAQDAVVALETTRRRIAAALPYDVEDLTLSHGLAGAADVLLCAASELGDEWLEAAQLAAHFGRVALERHGTSGEHWPCGVVGGKTPGLFRGTSGIGWWFLRLQDGAVPSPLTMPDWPLTPARTRA